MIGRARFRLVAFDLLAVGGDDIRSDPFHARIARLAKLLAKAGDASSTMSIWKRQLTPHGRHGLSLANGSYATGYPASNYGGGYATRSYVTGRPTLFPRYYGGWN